MKQYFEVKLSFFNDSPGIFEGIYLVKAESITKSIPTAIRRLRIPSDYILKTSSEQRVLVYPDESREPFKWWRVTDRSAEDREWTIQAETKEFAIAIAVCVNADRNAKIGSEYYKKLKIEDLETKEIVYTKVLI
jgi:hypothetical protein